MGMGAVHVAKHMTVARARVHGGHHLAISYIYRVQVKAAVPIESSSSSRQVVNSWSATQALLCPCKCTSGKHTTMIVL